VIFRVIIENLFETSFSKGLGRSFYNKVILQNDGHTGLMNADFSNVFPESNDLVKMGKKKTLCGGYWYHIC
jgi:hypothetical protein